VSGGKMVGDERSGIERQSERILEGEVGGKQIQEGGGPKS
jgi:hypothetical protein